jgi:hypothetical protein
MIPRPRRPRSWPSRLSVSYLAQTRRGGIGRAEQIRAPRLRAAWRSERPAATRRRMRLGWAATTAHFSSCAPDAGSRVLRAGVHSTLHGVVFAILCLDPPEPPDVPSGAHNSSPSCFNVSHENLIRCCAGLPNSQALPIQFIVRPQTSIPRAIPRSLSVGF